MLIRHLPRSLTLLFFFTLLQLGVANKILANCTLTSINDGLSYYTSSSTLSPTPTAFNPNAYTIGQVIYTGTINIKINNTKPTSLGGSCTEAWGAYYKGMGIPTNNIYPTNISGLGMKLSYGTYIFPTIMNTYQAGQFVPFGSNYTLNIQLIKTGNITAGGVLSGTFFEVRESSDSGQLLVQATLSPVTIQVLVPTCSVSTPSITVPLNTLSTGNFKGIGTVSANQNFQIGLSCSGGSNGTSTNAYITFTDANNLGNTSTILTLPGGNGAATGLGLQILNKGTPIGYGPDSSDAGNTNQWQVANIAQGVSSYFIPLSVRYIQTGNTVTPGTVNGRATFTMSYQ